MNSNHALVVQGISKSFATIQAVDDLSFEVEQGEIFGLLGPNGAGKTTSIRMILDIIKPDSGEISVLGGPMTEAKKSRIGYLPEERGLYDDMTLMDTLLFLGQLKELSRQQAAQRAEAYLREVKLWDARELKIEALSRGMTQKAQFVAATMHEPDLIIIDEPFAGLDPVNTRIVKDLLYRMRDRGAAIIMSTHQTTAGACSMARWPTSAASSRGMPSRWRYAAISARSLAWSASSPATPATGCFCKTGSGPRTCSRRWSAARI
jgi:ABC-2 type transport system ATP-binding protein